VEVDEIGGVAFELAPARLAAANRPGIGEVLPRKNEHHVASLLTKRHHVTNGVVSHAPADVHTRRFLDPRSGGVERLVAQRRHHQAQLSLCRFRRASRDEPDESWHGAGSCYSVDWNLRSYQALRSSRSLSITGWG